MMCYAKASRRGILCRQEAGVGVAVGVGAPNMKL